MKKIYSNEYWELVRQNIMGDTKMTATMKKITTKGPMSLQGLSFNIPLFNAKTQMYRCDEVKDTTIGVSGNKNYTLYFSWIPTSYSVPEKLEININIPVNSSSILLTIDEINGKGHKYNLRKNAYLKTKISSLASIREIFKSEAEKM